MRGCVLTGKLLQISFGRVDGVEECRETVTGFAASRRAQAQLVPHDAQFTVTTRIPCKRRSRLSLRPRRTQQLELQQCTDRSDARAPPHRAAAHGQTVRQPC